jgi:hypothetical protein
MYNYFHDFRRVVKCAMMKIEIAIENGWSLTLRQMQASNLLSNLLSTASTKLTKNEVHPACKWAAGWVRGAWRGEVEKKR